MEDQLLLEAKPTLGGRGVGFRIYRDRVEIEQKRHLSAGKLTAGVLTGGASLLVTGVNDRKHEGSEVLPMSKISSVLVSREGFGNWMVTIRTASGEIKLGGNKALANQIKDLIIQQMTAN